MLRKRRVLIFIVFMGLVGIVYAHGSIYSVSPFITLSLSDPTAPINELFNMHYALSSYVARTPVAVDAKGYFYIVGGKDSKVQILVLNPKGKIERIITPRLKDSSPLEYCPLISVSPSGKRIWTITPTFPKLFTHRVIVHDQNGIAEMDWIVKGGSTIHWLINAYSEESAYGVVGGADYLILRFVVGQKQPQEYQAPFFPLFFHNGKYWTIMEFDELMKYIPGLGDLVLKNWIEQTETERVRGVVTWSPEEGYRLIKTFPSPVKFFNIHGIDQQGNFYYFRGLPLIKTPMDYLLSFLFKINPLAKAMQAFGIHELSGQNVIVLQILSTNGKILDTIIIPAVIRPARGEELKYGQLVKADETGIYLEVERVSEPKEYRIVKIVKKRRLQVWLERLMKTIEK